MGAQVPARAHLDIGERRRRALGSNDIGFLLRPGLAKLSVPRCGDIVIGATPRFHRKHQQRQCDK